MSFKTRRGEHYRCNTVSHQDVVVYAPAGTQIVSVGVESTSRAGLFNLDQVFVSEDGVKATLRVSNQQRYTPIDWWLWLVLHTFNDQETGAAENLRMDVSDSIALEPEPEN